MKNNKNKMFIIGLSIAVFGLILSITYRQYIYNNNLNDFHIADTIGSLVCVPSASLVMYSLTGKFKFNKLVLICFISYLLYELFGLTGLYGTFDIYDIYALLISTSLLLILNIKIFKL